MASFLHSCQLLRGQLGNYGITPPVSLAPYRPTQGFWHHPSSLFSSLEVNPGILASTLQSRQFLRGQPGDFGVTPPVSRLLRGQPWDSGITPPISSAPQMSTRGFWHHPSSLVSSSVPSPGILASHLLSSQLLRCQPGDSGITPPVSSAPRCPALGFWHHPSSIVSSSLAKPGILASPLQSCQLLRGQPGDSGITPPVSSGPQRPAQGFWHHLSSFVSSSVANPGILAAPLQSLQLLRGQTPDSGITSPVSSAPQWPTLGFWHHTSYLVSSSEVNPWILASPLQSRQLLSAQPWDSGITPLSRQLLRGQTGDSGITPPVSSAPQRPTWGFWHHLSSLVSSSEANRGILASPLQSCQLFRGQPGDSGITPPV